MCDAAVAAGNAPTEDQVERQPLEELWPNPSGVTRSFGVFASGWHVCDVTRSLLFINKGSILFVFVGMYDEHAAVQARLFFRGSSLDETILIIV